MRVVIAERVLSWDVRRPGYRRWGSSLRTQHQFRVTDCIYDLRRHANASAQGEAEVWAAMSTSNRCGAPGLGEADEADKKFFTSLGVARFKIDEKKSRAGSVFDHQAS